MQIRDRVVGQRRVRAGDLVPNAKNWRTHNEGQRAALRGVLAEVGYVGTVVCRDIGGGALEIIDGHLRAEIMPDEEITVTVVDLDDAEAAKVLATYDPIAAMAGVDPAKLDELLREIDTGSEGVQTMLGDLADAAGLYATDDDQDATPAMAWPDPDDDDGELDQVPDVPAEPITKPGDVWQLGRHLLICGDSTQPADVGRIVTGPVDAIVTDPPYCSGGFQEAGKSAGSVGRRDKSLAAIANDRLSSRGFAALLKAAFGNVDARYIYAFTDWRMWIQLFDVAESAGFPVRSMIVWDKKSAGLGWGWRCQHELILWGCRDKPPADQATGAGNVIQCARTRNKNHTTEKPVELMAKLFEVAPFIETCFEPFAGSGTTLVAAEQMGRTCYAVELSPGYCDVIVERWETLTGEKATRS